MVANQQNGGLSFKPSKAIGPSLMVSVETVCADRVLMFGVRVDPVKVKVHGQSIEQTQNESKMGEYRVRRNMKSHQNNAL